MNKLEKIYKEIRDKGDIEKTSIICSNLFIQTDFNFRVFVSIQIPVFTDFDPYKNESLVMTLNVEKNGQIEFFFMNNLILFVLLLYACKLLPNLRTFDNNVRY